MAALPNIVLVHGAWADGSCWSDVIERLQGDGYKVTAPQLPETSLADDVARVRHVLTRQSGPTVLAGHSYGGQVITSLGTDAPNVVASSTSRPSGSTRVSRSARCSSRVLRPRRWQMSMSTRRASAGSPRTISSVTSPPISTRSRRRSCTPCSSLCTVHVRRRHGRPRVEVTALVVSGRRERRVIPPDAERQFAQRMGADTIEVASGHCAMVSHPEETHERIVTAAKAVAVPG